MLIATTVQAADYSFGGDHHFLGVAGGAISAPSRDAGPTRPTASSTRHEMSDDENDPTDISSTDISITVGTDEELAYTLTGTDPIHDEVEATSSNTAVFTVPSSPVSGGTVTLHPVAAGSATLTLTAKNQDGTTAATTSVTVTVGEAGLYVLVNNKQYFDRNGDGSTSPYNSTSNTAIYYLSPTSSNVESGLRVFYNFTPDRVWRMNPSATTTTMQNYSTGYYIRHTADNNGSGCVKMDDTEDPSATTYRYRFESYNSIYAIKPYQYKDNASTASCSFNPFANNRNDVGLWQYNNDIASQWLYYPVSVTEHEAVMTEFTVSGDATLYTTGASNAYSHTNSTVTVGYTTFVFNGGTHQWYNNTDNGETAPTAAEATEGYVWSLTENSYATVDAETGVITVSSIPESGDVVLTLTCTLTSGTSTQTATQTVTIAANRAATSVVVADQTLPVGVQQTISYSISTTSPYVVYDQVEVTSSNTNVFTVLTPSVSGGSITLQTISEGTATLTIVAKRQDGTTACSSTATITVDEAGLYVLVNRKNNFSKNGDGNSTSGQKPFYLYPTSDDDGSPLRVNYQFAPNRVWRMTPSAIVTTMQNYSTGFYIQHGESPSANNYIGSGCVWMDDIDAPSGTDYLYKLELFEAPYYAIKPYMYKDAANTENSSFNPYRENATDVGLFKYSGDAASQWSYYQVTVTDHSEVITDFTVSGDEVIYMTGDEAYTHSNTYLTIAYTTYNFNSADHHWYNSTDNGTTVPASEEIADQSLYSWSITENDYATVDPSTGVITVSSLPTSADVEVTLTCTMTSGTYTKTATKTVTIAAYRNTTSISANNQALIVGTDYDLAYTLSEDGSYTTFDLVYATTSDENVFTVTGSAISGGVVTLHPVTPGQATLTLVAKQSDGTTDACSTSVTITVTDQVATPVITYLLGDPNTTVNISCATEGASIYYTTDGSEPSTSSQLYQGTITIASTSLPVTITAIGIKGGYYTNSLVVVQDIVYGSGTSNDPYILASVSDLAKIAAHPTDYFKVVNDIDATGFGGCSLEFSGSLDGGLYTISNLTSPLFTTVSGATIKNVILDGVTIDAGDGNGDAGAIACSASGATRIYNCGVLATTTSSVTGTRYVGSLVGKLDGNTRVINCYSFATVNGGTWGAGIVGYNSTATTLSNITTSGMVMNCMFYGEVTSGTSGIAPVFGGENISNDNTSGTALNTFNYFRFMADFCQNEDITVYNCALAAKEMYIKRMDFYRYMLNSNRELAAWYATGSVDDADSEMAKWVLDKSIAEYPILKQQGTYPSIINFDAANATTQTERNKGGLLGTLSVSISGTGTGAPSAASITTSSLTLNITDKDPDNYNFNYYKVQLPYYNEVGTGNYTSNKVVTGWKITSIRGGTPGDYNTSSQDASITDGVITTPYNFADRNCTNKDLYGTDGSNRIFPQGGYFNVPEGVTAITIEPYWGTAVYLSDPNYDRVYSSSYGGTDVTIMGTRSYTINESSQTVYTSVGDALDQLVESGTVYDQAIVLVGNYHLYAGNNDNPFGNSIPCTIMSIDQNLDNEPDYSLIFHFHERKECPPLRFDFINVMPFGMAQKVFSASAPQMPNIAIFKPKGWFEVTTTCVVEFTEFEYDCDSKTQSPLIFLGGYVGQIISQNMSTSYDADRTTYIHLGDNVYFKDFSNGIHSDKSNKTRHCPISVTGGEYENFYLSGLYKPDANYFTDNAECYVNGGKFGEVAGAAYEKIDGDVYWLIDHADITNFYGGGINANKPISGNINVTINNSRVKQYCGGPKFGDMANGKTVITQADGSTFDTYFGAGYGGTSLNRVIKATDYQKQDYDWSSWDNNYTRSYSSSDGGISTSFETEFFAWAGGTSTTNVGRFYVNFASLSLAKTLSVTSTLTNCTVNNDFYGGGNLGAVEGDVTSTLTGCTIHGNVYGAGFSATVPTVDVFPSSPTWTPPSYNSNVGQYYDPVYPASVSYTWSSTGSTSAPFTDDEDGNWIYTDVDLTGLGKVTGDIDLTVNGSTVVKGSVFGGGNAAAVVGDTEVKVMQAPRIYNSVYGGGNQGEVDGDTKVIVNGTVTN